MGAATELLTNSHAALRAAKAVRIAGFLRRQLGLALDLEALRLASPARWTEIARLAGERHTDLSPGTIDAVITVLEQGGV